MKLNHFHIIGGIYLSLLLIAFGACNDSSENEETQWILVWQDEFDGTAGQAPDASKWVYDVGTDWGNAQLEYDTDRTKNVSLDGNGRLAIVAYAESYKGAAFTSGRIKTQDLFEQKYGRFEASIKMPYGPGIWPAFWLLGANVETVGWPQCGEIDIVEYKGQEPNIIHGTIHGPGYSAGGGITQSFGFENKRFDTDFHVYAVEWTEDRIDFFLDDILYKRITPDMAAGEWAFDHTFYIILNLAVGGSYVGFPTADTNFPQTMLVDWVRVYETEGL